MFRSERDFFLLRNGVAAATQAARETVAQGRRDAFESHRHRAFSLAFYMTGNELEAEEILTGTFIRAFEHSDRPDAYDVDSALLDEFRTRLCLEPELPLAAPSAEPALKGRSVRRPELEAALLELPANERLLFLLRDVEGYSPAAIAKLLDLPEPELQRLLLSARLRLCQKLTLAAKLASEAA